MPALRTRDTQSRSALEVTTEATLQLEPPALAIISPTPRAFTFPINQPDRSSSPYSSPSSSPDLKPFTPPSLVRTLSPVSSITSISSAYSSSPSTSSHKRRKSSCSELEHRPKKGDDDYIKRPENAFILFRRHCCEERQAAAEEADGPAKKQRQADLSKTISQQWKSLTAEERQVWEERAKEKKKEHERMHPNYVYRPQRSKKRSKGKLDEEDTDNNISFMLPLAPPATRHGRSASAPTPPLGYQAIHLPNVYMPSCPTSPLVMPMMNRRASAPGHSEESSTHFDFLPQETLEPASFSQGQYDSCLAPPEFFTGMFNEQHQHTLTDKQNTLQRLAMPEHMHIAPHELMSPASSIQSSYNSSGYSSPTSPQAGPFTPHHTLQRQYSLPQDPEEHCSMDMQPMDTGSPTDVSLEYPAYVWEGGSNMWNNSQEMMLGNDFDLNAIPPIELGTAKFQDEMNPMDSSAPMPEYGHDHYALHHEQYHDPIAPQGFDGLFFSDMLSGQGY